MKKIFSLFAAILFAGSIFAVDEVSTLTFTAACGGSGIADDGVAWTVTSDADESNFDGTKGIHYGTGSKKVGYINLTSSDITSKITKVVVNASGASGTNGKVAVKVGDVIFQCEENDTVPLTGSATNYTFVGEAEGEILVSIFKPSAANGALYCKSVAVTYEAAADAPSLSADPIKIDFGTVTQNALVEDKEITVTFENLTGDVVYEGLDAPFTATGTITATGDKISISANTEEIGTFADTLVIKSEADEKEVKVAISMKVKAPEREYQLTYDFSAIPDFNEWGSSYLPHEVAYTDATAKFASANHQSGTITDIPVSKGGDLELVLVNDKKVISAVKFVCRQWTTKEQTIELLYSLDGGENYASFDPELTSDNFEIEHTSLPAGTNAVKISFSSASNQVGYECVKFDLKDVSTALDNTVSDSKAVKTIVNGQLLITRDGKCYNVLGTLVR